MGDYSATLLDESFADAAVYHTRGPKHQLAGVDNLAFMPRPYTISSDISNYNQSANHLIYGRSQNSLHPNNDSHFYSSTQKSSIYVENFTIPEQPASIGSSMRRDFSVGDLEKSDILGRSSAPVNFVRAPPFNIPTLRKKAKHNIMPGRRPISSKADCVSFFDIEMDKVPGYQYRPGENVTGTIIIIVHKSFEIKFVELAVTGQGEVKVKTSGDQHPRTFRQTYLHKEKCFLGAMGTKQNSILTPGFYSSKFRVKLPVDLPSTVHYEDAFNGFTCNIAYSLKVRICEDAGTRLSRHGHIRKVKVLLEKQVLFTVQRGFDLSVIPDAGSPIIHTKQVYLSCAHQQPAEVTVNLDRAVFLAGDSIRVELLVSLPSSQSVKDVKCSLQEHVTIDDREPIIFTLSKITREDPNVHEEKSTNPRLNKKFELYMPTNMHLVSPYILGNSKFKMAYFLFVDLRFTPAGGKLSFKIPIGIGPCAEPIYAEKTSSRKAIPLFNRTMRFPCFSLRGTPPLSSSLRPSTPRSAASVTVTTKYTNGYFARLFLCCFGAGS